MFGKFTAVVGGDGFKHFAFVGEQEPPYDFCQRLGFLSLLQFLHEQEINLSANGRFTDTYELSNYFLCRFSLQFQVEMIGQQYPSDTGPIDILAKSKDGKTWLVIELKKGRTSDVVVGQIQRYMGYVKEELAEPDQQVKGAIIGLDADNRLKRALSVTTNIEFYAYHIDFKLNKL